MFKTRKSGYCGAAFLLLGFLLVACGGSEPVEVTRVVTEQVTVEVPVVVDGGVASEPVTYYRYSTTDLPTLDPQVAEDAVSINWIENLFVHLTNYDEDTNEIVPEAATNWQISDDGLTYTFTIRNDIPWVKYNPATGETTQEIELDEDGNEIGPRFVTARDFEYGIKRACDPNIGSYYSTVVAPLIVGCLEVLNSEEPNDEEAMAALMDDVGVTAVDEATLQVELAFPAAYFLSMTPMWTLAAAPQWAIEEHGNDNWNEAGRIVTNGRFVLHEWIHDVRRTMIRNPLMPSDMIGEGNVDTIVSTVVPDTSTGYALWLQNEVDFTGAIPDAELEAFRQEFPDETIQIPDLAVFYIAFRETKPPFDDPQVRRAFSAAFDRETFVRDVLQGQGLPMIHFAPPGIFGAPPIGEVGIGFDAEFARSLMEAAGYPNCEGFPQVSLLGFSGQNTLNWIEFAQAQWQEHLGCSADLIRIEQQPFSELLAATAGDVPDEESPHMWTLGWSPDYADENNWVGDVLWCGNPDNRQKRECNEIDDLIVQAREETDPNRRIELYRQIEELFFGPEGEIPFFPIRLRIGFAGQHTWLDHTQALFGGQQWYNTKIQQDAQLAARGQ